MAIINGLLNGGGDGGDNELYMMKKITFTPSYVNGIVTIPIKIPYQYPIVLLTPTTDISFNNGDQNVTELRISSDDDGITSSSMRIRYSTAVIGEPITLNIIIFNAGGSGQVNKISSSPHIECGQYKFPYLAYTTGSTKKFSFYDAGFSKSPHVFITLRTNNNSIRFLVNSINTTNMVVDVYNKSSSLASTDVTLYWVAIG